MPCVLAFDTSNYTTSAAFLNTETGRAANVSRLLPVSQGSLGLRQSDAVFAHIKALPSIMAELAEKDGFSEPDTYAASNAPRDKTGSYMPCFLVGEGHASVEASSHRAKLLKFSHQQGHIAAAAYSSGALELLGIPFLAWHLSGGTTELLLVQPDDDSIIKEEIIGGTTDISAGQLIDRAGVSIGLDFPAGRELSHIAEGEPLTLHYKVHTNECRFSLSGMENRVRDMLIHQKTDIEVANFVINTVIYAVDAATKQALALHPGLPVLFSGGVASSGRMREVMSKRYESYFAKPEYSTDNALGIAVLAALKCTGFNAKWTKI